MWEDETRKGLGQQQVEVILFIHLKLIDLIMPDFVRAQQANHYYPRRVEGKRKAQKMFHRSNKEKPTNCAVQRYQGVGSKDHGLR